MFGTLDHSFLSGVVRSQTCGNKGAFLLGQGYAICERSITLPSLDPCDRIQGPLTTLVFSGVLRRRLSDSQGQEKLCWTAYNGSVPLASAVPAMLVFLPG